ASEMRHHLAHPNLAVDAARLKHDPDPFAQAAGALVRILAEHADRARGAVTVALEDLHRARLARPIRPQEPVDLTALDRKVDTAHRFQIAVGLAEVTDLDCRGRRHAAPIMQHPCSVAW